MTRDPRLSELIAWTEACTRYGVTLYQLKYAQRHGQIEPVRIPGGKTLLHKDDVKQWLANRRDDQVPQ